MEIKIYPRAPEKSYAKLVIEDFTVEDAIQAQLTLAEIIKELSELQADRLTKEIILQGATKQIPINS